MDLDSTVLLRKRARSSTNPEENLPDDITEVEEDGDARKPSSPRKASVLSTDEKNFLEQSDVEDDQFDEEKISSELQEASSKRGFVHSENNAKPLGFFQFFWAELSRGYELENDEARYTEKRKKVYAFIKIPKELEKFLFYGFLQCTDAFLYFFTFLPLRFLLALLRLISYPVRQKRLTPSEICDVLRVLVLSSTFFAMQFVDTSIMYHLVRGQAIIKLYIFYNMLEVADKLLSSFGQDILDALFWTATEPGSVKNAHANFIKTTGHLALAIFYVITHTMLVLFQVTTLNVAFNSHNKALLTIMLSNNFVELKGSVFKKFAKGNLFQMACSDVRERFHNCILLGMVVVRNMTAVNWKLEHFVEMCPDLAMVLFAEFLVDWFKHAFITKFNEIPYEVYKDFTITIAYDAAKSRQENAFADLTDQVSRRMGFIPLPLTVLLSRILSQSLRIQTSTGLCLLVLSYVALVTIKILNSIVLLGKAAKYIQTYESVQEQAELLSRLRKKKAQSLPVSPRLSLVEFSDIMAQYHKPIKGYTVSDVLQHAAELAAAQIAQEEEARNQKEAAKIKRSKSVHQLNKRHQRKREGSGEVGSGDVSPSGVEDGSCGISPISVELPAVTSEEDGVSVNSSPKHRAKMESECESLQSVDRYTLVNNDRIEP